MEPTQQPSPERSGTGEQINVPEAPQPAVSSGAPAGPAPVPVMPTKTSAPQASSAAPAAVPGQNPAVAADQDVIEKEWVDKAEEVIGKTAGDPHAEEEAVEDLQIDYMKKRYNKDIKKSQD